MYRVVIFFLIAFAWGCGKNQAQKTATLADYTGMDGCNWVLVLDTPDDSGAKTLEPINLDEFGITKQAGKKVLITYAPIDAASICMVGTTVKLNSISYAD